MGKPYWKSGALHPLFRDVKLQGAAESSELDALISTMEQMQKFTSSIQAVNIPHQQEGCFVGYVTIASIDFFLKTLASYGMAFHPAQSFAAGFISASCSGSSLACGRRGNLCVHRAAERDRRASIEPGDQSVERPDCDPDGNTLSLRVSPPEV